mgnify:CR=1 FL=1
MKIRKNKNLERIEDIKREIKNNPKKRYIFNKRIENIKLKYEKKIRELEKEKKEYINEISERFKEHKNPEEEMYSIQHLHHILNEKGEKELKKIEKEFNEILPYIKKSYIFVPFLLDNLIISVILIFFNSVKYKVDLF